MKKEYRIVSYGTYLPRMYRDGIARIYCLCHELGMPSTLKILGPTNHPKWYWYETVLYKPVFIKEMLGTYDQTLMWIDADCQILSTFDLPEGDWDIGLIPHPNPRNRKHFTPWLVSCFVIRPTPQARLLLEIWEHLCQWPEYADVNERQESDHERLMWTLAIMGDTIKVKNILPSVRGRVYLDPRHRKRNKLTYEEVSKELDDWYPDEIKLPKDKCIAIMERVGELW